jgi:hypothetical protein
MSTHADFYIGRGLDAEWIGSMHFDGYPQGMPARLLQSVDSVHYRALVEAIIEKGNGYTVSNGWPWPWENSRETEFAYAYDDGVVYVSNYGSIWRELADEVRDDLPVFPSMTQHK